MPETDSLQLEFSALSDVGRTRSNNQDACGEFSRDDGLRLFVVCDGMGGHEGGATASRIAVETIGAIFEQSSEPPEFLLEEALEEANRRIHAQAAAEPSLHGMGTTGVALLLGAGDFAWFAHVGDSRVYRLRHGQLEALTADHSLVAELVRKGMLTPEQAETHPQRNIISRSLGPDREVRVDVSYRQIEAGDQFVLCTDGLWGEVADPAIAAVLQREPAATSASRLVELANQNGGRDNVTVQVILVRALPAQAVAHRAPESRPEPILERDETTEIPSRVDLVPGAVEAGRSAQAATAPASPPRGEARAPAGFPAVRVVALAAAGVAALLVVTLISWTRMGPKEPSPSAMTAPPRSAQPVEAPAPPTGETIAQSAPSPEKGSAETGSAGAPDSKPPADAASVSSSSPAAAAPTASSQAPMPRSLKLLASKHKVRVGDRVDLQLRGDGKPVVADFFGPTGQLLGNGLSFSYAAEKPGKQRIRAQMVGAVGSGKSEVVLDVSASDGAGAETASAAPVASAEKPAAPASKEANASPAPNGHPAGPAPDANPTVPPVATAPAKAVVASSLPAPHLAVELTPTKSHARVGDAIPYALVNKRSGEVVEARFFVNGKPVPGSTGFEFKPTTPGSYTVAARPANEPEGTQMTERHIEILATDTPQGSVPTP